MYTTVYKYSPSQDIMNFLYILFISVQLASYFKTSLAGASTRKFSNSFLFGASASAYQYEGAWNVSGKGPSIWDIASHTVPSPIIDNSTGDVACDSYHLYKTDAAIAKNLGLNFIKLSISWPRVLPTGFANEINQDGIDFYNNVINEMMKNNITVLMTIYHWDLPQPLQLLGGWANPDVVRWFTDYANVLFKNFGDRVKLWATINEPTRICVGGYGSTKYAPFLNMSGIAEYMCAKNILLAHAETYQLYNKCYKTDQQGQVGIVLNSKWYEPLTYSTSDIQAASDQLQFRLGLFANPIFSKTGDFPEVVKRRIAVKSLEQGYPRSRLPLLTRSQIKKIRGSSDYFGLNSYSSTLVYRNCSVNELYSSPSFLEDAAVAIVPNTTVQCGLYKLLQTIKLLYNNPVLYITGNGISTKGGLNDVDRINYMKTELNNVWDAICNGSDIRGYAARSLMDNFEWTDGYTKKTGLYEVDFASKKRTRRSRKSAEYYKNVIKTRSIKAESYSCGSCSKKS